MSPRKIVLSGPGRTHMPIPRGKRYLELMDGTLSVEDLDDEEIFRGQLKDAGGKFGPATDLVPRELHNALARELKHRLQTKFEQAAMEAVDAIVDVMRNGEGEQFSQFEKAGTKRLEAAKYIVERVMGPLAKANEIAPETTPWQEQVGDGTLIVDITPDEEDAHLITKVESRRAPVRRRGAKSIKGEVVE